jgi:DNA adenine methylase
MLSNMSYGGDFNGGFSYDRSGKTTKAISSKREAFAMDCAARPQQTQIECCDALRIIRSRDTSGAFFYIDPPYVGASQGQYAGYTQDSFDKLLKLLEGIQGKFLLSSFRNDALREFIKRNGWHSIELKMSCPYDD